MGVRFKLGLIFTTLIVGSVIFWGWSAQTTFSRYQTEKLSESLREDVHLLSSLVDRQFSELREELIEAIRRRQEKPESQLSLKEEGPLALIRLDKNENRVWQAKWMDQVPGLKLSVEKVTQEIYRLFPANKVSEEKLTVAPLKYQSVKLREPLIAVAVPLSVHFLKRQNSSEKVLYVGVFPISTITKYIDAFKSMSGLQKLIDDEGRVLIADEERTIGREIADEISAGIVRQKELSGFLHSSARDEISQRVFYRQLDDTNLYLTSSQPDDFYTHFAAWMSLGGMVSLLAVLLGLSLIWIFLRKPVAMIDTFGQVLEGFARGNSQMSLSHQDGDVVPPKMLEDLKLVQNRLSEVKKSEPKKKEEVPKNSQREEEVKGVIRELAVPLTTILGTAQNGRLLSKSPEVLKYFTSIAGEAEKLQRFVDNIGAKIMSEDSIHKECDLMQVSNRAINQVSSEQKHLGVTVRKNYHAVPLVCGQELRLQAAIAGVLKNSLQSASQAEKKEVIVGLEPCGQAVCLSVTDWGAHQPLSETDGEKITEVGLLSAVGTLTSHKGEVTIDYSEEGCRVVKIFLPLKNSEVKQKNRVILPLSYQSIAKEGE